MKMSIIKAELHSALDFQLTLPMCKMILFPNLMLLAGGL